MTMNRRDFMRVGVAAAGTLMLPRISFAKAMAANASAAFAQTEPHFYLQIVMNGGADSSYLFDARPLGMTAAGKIQNYTGVDPTPYVGTNGVSCLTTKHAAPLLKLKDRFSILNGVVMDADFDGHNQNMNYFFAGSPFGGESFIPHLNLATKTQPKYPFDAIQNGSLFAQLENLSGVIPLGPDAATALAAKLHNLHPATSGSALIDFIRGRYAANAGGQGRFAQGSQAMLSGLDSSVEVQTRLLQMPPTDPNAKPEDAFMAMICGAFQKGLSRSAIWVFPESFDVHAADSAKTQPAQFADVASRIAMVFQKLVDTPYDATRSMLDVTTVMVTTEFSRTMRNGADPIDATGTNHNPLTNSLIIGGKGIKSGLVIGSSDFQSANETLSGAHIQHDAELVKIMGKPFDFKTMTSRSDLPAAFDVTDYLTIGSVVNTLYTSFGAPTSRLRTYSRSVPKVIPVLDGLLS